MLLRLDDIPPGGLDVTVPLAAGALGAEGFSASGPLTGEFHLERHGSQVLVRGRFKGRFRTPCARCLRETEASVDEGVFVEFRPLPASRKGEERERELTTGDLDVEFYQGEALDLGEFLAGQVRLALPMKPLCSEACQGMCPACGKLRAEGCRCTDALPDDRWEALLGLIKKRSDEPKPD